MGVLTINICEKFPSLKLRSLHMKLDFNQPVVSEKKMFRYDRGSQKLATLGDKSKVSLTLVNYL